MRRTWSDCRVAGSAIDSPCGAYFGTLCGLDPAPAALSDKTTVATMRLFAELIPKQRKTQDETVSA